MSTFLLYCTILQMDLIAENSQNCIFKILPRYKVRSVGGEVSMGSKVVQKPSSFIDYLCYNSRYSDRVLEFPEIEQFPL